MQITIYYGNQNLGSYDLEQFHKEVVSFGRQPDNDIVLNYDFVSRVHGVFYKENCIWYVQGSEQYQWSSVRGQENSWNETDTYRRPICNNNR